MSEENDNQENGITRRDRGILTHADRQYLAGMKDLATQSERDARLRIRNRVKNGLLDFLFLVNLEDGDREMVFEQVYDDSKIFGPPIFHFLFQGMMDLYRSQEHAIESFESYVKSGLITGITRQSEDNVIVNVDVDINTEIREPDKDELLDNLAAGNASITETMYLLTEEDVESKNQRLLLFLNLIDHMISDELFKVSGRETTFYFEEEGKEEQVTVGPEDFESIEEYVESMTELVVEYQE